MLTNDPPLSSHTQGICQVLARLAQDADLSVAAEALNSIFDLFAEEDVNDVVASGGLMAVLEALLPSLKSKVCIFFFCTLDVRVRLMRMC